MPKIRLLEDKSFSAESIAEFLGIDSNEVIEITKRALLLYKQSISEFIDETVKYIEGNQNTACLIRKK